MAEACTVMTTMAMMRHDDDDDGDTLMTVAMMMRMRVVFKKAERDPSLHLLAST